MFKITRLAYFFILVQGFILAHSFVPHHHHQHEHDSSCLLDLSEYHQRHYHDLLSEDHKHEKPTIFDILFSNMHHSHEGIVCSSNQDLQFSNDKTPIKDLATCVLEETPFIAIDVDKGKRYEQPHLVRHQDKYKQHFSLRGPPFFIV